MLAAAGYEYGISLNEVSQTVWTTAMTGAAYSSVELMCSDGKLFAGSNGTSHELQPTTGARLQTLELSAAVNEPVRFTVDQHMLVAGCHGYTYGIRLDDWAKGAAWSAPMAGKLYDMVDVAL